GYFFAETLSQSEGLRDFRKSQRSHGGEPGGRRNSRSAASQAAARQQQALRFCFVYIRLFSRSLEQDQRPDLPSDVCGCFGRADRGRHWGDEYYARFGNG